MKTLNPQPPTPNPQFSIPAPLSGWRRLAADWAAVGGSTLVCQALAVVTSLVLRGALNPSQMGVWQGLKLLLGYANYANLGVSKGAARELAVAVGKGQQKRAEQGLNLAFTVNTITSVLYGCCLAAAGLWFAANRGLDSPWFLGLLALAVLVVLQRHLTFHITILRCRQQFTLTAWISLVEGTLTLLAAGLGAWWWGLAGLYGGTLLTMAGSLAFLRWQGVRPFHFGWQWGQIVRLVAIGGPILLGGVALGLFQSLDKLMLLSFSPDREFELGCYSTTLLITAQIYGLANMFAMVVAPRYAELFGRTGTPHAAAALAARTSEPLAAVASAAAVVGLLAAVPLLAALFPDYRPGLPPALWLVPGVVLLALTLPPNQYLVAVGRERTSLLASIAALAAAAIADYSALRLGYGMLGVGAATALVYAGYYVLVVRLSIWPVIDPASRRRFLWTQAALLAPVALAVCLTDVRAAGFDPTSLAMPLAIVLAVWGLAVLVVWRHGAWQVAWRAEAPVREGKMQNAKRKTPNDAGHRPAVRLSRRHLIQAPYHVARFGFRFLRAAALVPGMLRRWVAERLSLRTIEGEIDRGAEGDSRRSEFPRSVHRRLTLAELEARCQKPDHRQVGTWTARRVARPLALRLTWLLAPTGVSAHAVTCAASVTALLAAACFATGGTILCLAGALLLQTWYLLDHVDGQVARLRGTSSLDGLQFDYLMHHLVNLTIPCALGYGLWKATGVESWLLFGFAFATGLLSLSLTNDTRSKAIHDRLEQLAWQPSRRPAAERRASRDEAGGVAHRTGRRLLQLGVHLARKFCEIQVVMNVTTILALAQFAAATPWLMEYYVAWMAPLALVTAVATLARDIRRGAAENELNRWLAAKAADSAPPGDRAEPEAAPGGDRMA